MSTRDVFIHANGDLLAAAAAARLVTCTADALAAVGGSHLVLTGGGIGTKVLAAIAASPARDAVDWRLVDFWWGDERFAPEGDPDRNETGARAALFDRIPVDPAQHIQTGYAVRGAKKRVGNLQLPERPLDRHDVHLIVLDEKNIHDGHPYSPGERFCHEAL